MQSAGGEGGWEEGRSSQGEKSPKLQEGLDKAAEDSGATVPPEVCCMRNQEESSIFLCFFRFIFLSF